MKELFVTKPSLPPEEEYYCEIKEIWKSGILTNRGPKHMALEKELEKRTGCERAELFTNGHTALEYALELLENGDGKGEIITTPFTFASTVNAIERKGFKPVFCDINGENLTLDAEKLENLINNNTKAVLPVHVYGNVCDCEKIGKIASKYAIPVIYDAAHAFGEIINGKDAAVYGDIAMFSFHATKVFGCAEGGALFFGGKKADEYAERVSKLRNFGLCGDDCEEAGGNGKMSELSASLGLCNLRHLEEYISARKKVYGVYEEMLSGFGEGLMLKDSFGLEKRNYAYCPLLFKTEEDLLKTAEKLEKENVHTRRYFYPPINKMSYYERKYGRREMKIAENISKRVLCLPLSSEMTEADAHSVCKIILG